MTLVICAFVALSVSFGTLAYVVTRPWKDRKLLRAFETLEEEFEDLRDNVRSSLGRVSRLKRAIMNGEVPPKEEAVTGELPSAEAPPSDGLSALTPRQRAIHEQILARRRRM